jgi:hypothetical protein
MQNIIEGKRPYYPCSSIHPRSHGHPALFPFIVMFPSHRHCTGPNLASVESRNSTSTSSHLDLASITAPDNARAGVVAWGGWASAKARPPPHGGVAPAAAATPPALKRGDGAPTIGQAQQPRQPRPHHSSVRPLITLLSHPDLLL